MTPLVLMVAPNGARRGKNDHPALPITPAEIAAEASRCREAGATILHLHVRDEEDRHALDPERYRAAIAAVEAAVGGRIAIQVTTESAGRFGPREQMQVVRSLRPAAVSLGLRELVADEAAVVKAARFFGWLRQEAIAPQYILYSADDVAWFHALRRRGVIPQARPFVLFVLGRYSGTDEARPDDLLPFLAAHEDPACPYAVCAFGRREAACVLTAAGLGGHVRVGFENNLWLADGRRAADNAALVAQVVQAAPLLDRQPAGIEATRAFLADTAR